MNAGTAYVLVLLALAVFIIGITVKLQLVFDEAVHLARRVDWSQEARDDREGIWASEKRWKLARAIAIVILVLGIVAPIFARKYGLL